MLETFGQQIWIADGPVVTGQAGFQFPTRMALIRLRSGALLVWSPVALASGLGAEVDALGPVRFLVAPNTLHHSFLGDWQRAYPQAEAWGVAELARQQPDLRLDGIIDGGAPLPWAGDLEQVVVSGNAITTEAVFFHAASGTVLFCDLLQQFPSSWFRGWRAIVARLDLMIGDEPAVPRKFRLAQTDRGVARQAFQQILEWPARQVLMAHGRPVTETARPFLGRAFAWLLRR